MTTPLAIRALQQRRKGSQTPGHDRRRSGRLQRETPRDTLRNLSRGSILLDCRQEVTCLLWRSVLAPISKQHTLSDDVHPTARGVENIREDGSEDELDPSPPRLSLNIGESDEDDSLTGLPPRLSVSLGDNGITQRSIEGPRRVYSEQPRNRLSRGSLGSTRLSDRFADIDELQSSDNPVYDRSSSPTRGLLVQDDLGVDVDLGLAADLSIRQHVLRYLNSELNNSSDEAASTQNHMNDGQHRALLGNGESTFILNIPPIEEPVLSPSTQSDEREERMEGFQQEDRAWDKHATSDHNKTSFTRARKLKPQRMSRRGIPYPSMPTSFLRRIAILHAGSIGFKKARLRKDTLEAIMQSSDWFLEQVGDDLGTFAKHSGRKTIDETDVTILLKRYVQFGPLKAF